tara:strand:- start:54 stop:374 length:321 start_codon:yes stop_codon:yes gene_type:complete
MPELPVSNITLAITAELLIVCDIKVIAELGTDVLRVPPTPAEVVKRFAPVRLNAALYCDIVLDIPPTPAAVIAAAVVLSMLAIFCNCLLLLMTSVPPTSSIGTFTT